MGRRAGFGGGPGAAFKFNDRKVDFFSVFAGESDCFVRSWIMTIMDSRMRGAILLWRRPETSPLRGRTEERNNVKLTRLACKGKS